jgi:hypothetical protein
MSLIFAPIHLQQPTQPNQAQKQQQQQQLLLPSNVEDPPIVVLPFVDPQQKEGATTHHEHETTTVTDSRATGIDAGTASSASNARTLFNDGQSDLYPVSEICMRILTYNFDG